MVKNSPILIIVAVVALMFLANPTEAIQNDNLFGCLDFNYKLDFQGVKNVDMTFFTVDGGEEILFKDDFATDSEKSTLLHCGHDYRAVYRAEGYEDFEEEFTVSGLMPMVSPVKKINFVKGGI